MIVLAASGDPSPLCHQMKVEFIVVMRDVRRRTLAGQLLFLQLVIIAVSS